MQLFYDLTFTLHFLIVYSVKWYIKWDQEKQLL